MARKLRLVLCGVLSCLGLQYPASAQGKHGGPTSAARSALELSFAANRGQFAEEVQFAARAPGYGLSLESGAARLLVLTRSGAPTSLRLRVLGARSVPAIGVGEQPFRLNYLLGPPSQWRSGVEAYQQVVYRGILPGVDWLFHGNAERKLQYDFVLAPGAMPSSLALVFDGARAVVDAASGALRLELSSGDRVEQAPPVAYQVDARGRRQLIAVRYAERADGSVGFNVGHYDHARELVVDPTLRYASYFGGSGFEDARAVATDSAGSVYLAGSTTLGLFPIRNALQPAYGGGSSDAFVCKLNAAGSALVYATFLGGADADVATGLAVDAAGAAYLVGYTLSLNFPTAAPRQSALAGSIDGFVAKLNPAGTALVYSSYLGGSGDDTPAGVVVDGTGAARIVGTTTSANFPTVAPFQAAFAGVSDAFVTFVNASGSALTFSSYLGGLGTETGTGIALDSLGSLYVVGATSSSDLPTANPFQGAFAGGGFDGFVTKLTASGSLVYSSYLGGSGRDEAAAVAVKPTGAAVVAGYSLSNNFPGTASGFQPSRAGNADAFVAEVSPVGDGLASSTYLGGTGNDRAQGVAVDASGAIYVAGLTASTDFPTSSPSQVDNAGGTDAFLAQLDATQLSYSSYFGGSSTDKAVALVFDQAGKTLAVVGTTTSSNFPMANALYPTSLGSQDAFVQRFSTAAPTPTPFGGWLASAVLAGLLTLGIIILSRKGATAPTAES